MCGDVFFEEQCEDFPDGLLIFFCFVDEVEPEVSLTSEGDGMAHGRGECVLVFMYLCAAKCVLESHGFGIGVPRFGYCKHTLQVLLLHPRGVGTMPFAPVGPYSGKLCGPESLKALPTRFVP